MKAYANEDEKIGVSVPDLQKTQNELTGLFVDDLPVGSKLAVETNNSLYEMEVREDGLWIKGGSYYPDWTRARFFGSTWGGSMIKARWVGVDMRMELGLDDKVITTSFVQSIKKAVPEEAVE